ncbi:MAG: HlyD family type I secretion periplasmic adaptor subunit [Cyanobacteria bacterium P01_F01_bin.53]
MNTTEDVYGGKQSLDSLTNESVVAQSSDQSSNQSSNQSNNWSEAIQSVLEQPPAQLPRYLIGVGLAFTTFFGLWAWVGKMQEVSQAKGELAPLGETYKIQPATDGKVEKILIEEGEQVRQGQLLFKLDSELLESEVSRLEKTLKSDQQSLAQVRSLMEKTRQENRAQQESVDASIQAQIATREQAQANTQTSQALVESIDSELAIREERLSRIATLEEQGAISREYVFDLEQGVREQGRTLTQTQGNIEQSLAQIRQIDAEIEQKRAEAQQVSLTAQQSLQKLTMEAETFQSSIDDTRNLLKQAQTRLAQSQVRSPSDGMVSSLDIDNMGEFTQPGETLAEIVPDGMPLVLSAIVPPSKAGLIGTGMTTQIKLDAFPYQNYGVLSGKVIAMSPDAKGNPETGSGYRVDIALEKDYVMHEQERVQLRIGQTASADIVVRQRRIIDLILEPIRRLSASDLNL